MKTTKEDFKIFKDEFVKWQRKFGLQGYKVGFRHEKDNGNYASISVDEGAKTAMVIMGKVLSKDAFINWNPKIVAKHEALHLLLHRLYWLGEQRYTNAGEMDHEWEKIVRVLEKVL